MKKPNMFIFGSERGGTTLLSALLTSNDNVFVLNDSFLYETFIKSYHRSFNDNIYRKFFLNTKKIIKKNYYIYKIFKKTYNKVKLLNKNSSFYLIDDLPSGNIVIEKEELKYFLEKLNNRYTNSLHWEDNNEWLSEYSKILKETNVVEKLKNRTLKEVFGEIYETLIPNDQKSCIYFGEKTPSHLYYSKWIKNLYPDSKIIVLIRNPITNISSLYKRMDKNLDLAIHKYLSFHKDSFDFLYNDDKHLVIRYEDLIYDTDKTLINIFKYLDIEESKKNSDFKYYIKADYVGNKIDPQRDIKSYNYLTKHQRDKIKNDCRKIINKYYPDLNNFYTDI